RALAGHVNPAEVARDAFRPLAAAAMAALWIVALHAAPPLLVAVAATITYLLTLWWTHALTDGELRILRRVFQSFVAPRAVTERPAGRLSP
ncbi:MAG: hypothetical protein ABIP29_02495, partial [Candidatus Eisenbacteria bacterium]